MLEHLGILAFVEFNRQSGLWVKHLHCYTLSYLRMEWGVREITQVVYLLRLPVVHALLHPSLPTETTSSRDHRMTMVSDRGFFMGFIWNKDGIKMQSDLKCST